MRMALVGSSAFSTDDQEDNDFFEQLANDLGDDVHVSELGKPVGLYRDYELEEANFTEGFSKLNISGAGSNLLSSTITVENGKTDSAGDDFWLEDALIDASAAASQEGIGDNRPTAKETLGNTGHAKGLSGALEDSHEEENAGICAQENEKVAENQDVDHQFNLSDVDNSSTLVFPALAADSGNSQVLDSELPLGDSAFVSYAHDLDSVDDVGQSVAGEALTRSSILSESMSLDPQNPVSADRFEMTEEHGSTNVKELQWSSYGQVFAHERAQGAFGSFSDFLTDLDAGTDLINASSGIGTQSRNEDNWSLPAPVAASTAQTEFETGTHANFDFGLSMGGFDSLNEPGVNNDEIQSNADEQAILSHTKVAEMSEPVLEHAGAGWQAFESDARGQAYGDFTVNNSSVESQSQGAVQQSWENSYPGWSYDYATNEWKQIEGYDFGTLTAAVVEQTSVLKDGSSDFPYGSNEPIASQIEAIPQGDGFFGNTTDLSYQASAQELAAGSSGEALGSMEETKVYTPSTDVYGMQSAHYDAVPQPQVYWEEQYPGWYYDYHNQEWRQIADNSHAWQLNAPSQDDKTVESHVVNPGSTNYDNSSSPMQMGQSQPEYQHQQNQNTHWAAENSQSLFTSGGGATTLSQSVSFNSWGASNLAFNANEQANTTTNNKREVFQGSAAVPDSWSGWQGYSNDAFRSPEQSQTDYLQANNSTVFGAQSSHYFPHAEQYPQAHNAPRTVTEPSQSSAGRPPHALAAFGFGGKFAVMKATSGIQVGTPGPIILHELKQLVETPDSSGQMNDASYFLSLNRQGLTGPLVGGGFTNKELFKWIDERADNCGLEDPYCSSEQGLHLLWNVLKIACMHYGKLRSMVGSAGTKSQGEDGPEVALGRLFAAMKSNRLWSHGLATSPDTLQSVPTEQQLQATAVEVKKSLVAGKRKEALQLAQQGQLWGPALVLAWQLGEKFYGDTVSQMAQQQFVPGSPLRTLFLLFAGQPTELFTSQNMPSSGPAQGPYSIGSYNSAKDSAGGMLGDWLENLSIIAANRTKGDEQIIMHLGDCLWKERGEVAGAHTCYLVAEANLESFSKNARLCLVGADHFKHQRTFATPQAIQRTELYEYSKVLGNSQYILIPFQPYKLLYAHMLAEAGKVAEARRYCQAVTKTLKNAGRGPEIESCRQSALALEERLRLHSQGGYSLNSATGKLVGKFIGTIDSTIHRIIGGPPPPQVSESLQLSHAIGNGKDWHASDQRTGNTAPQANFTPLVPSASINSFFNANNQVEVPTRSISEPDFSRSPTQETPIPAKNSDGRSAAPIDRKTESSGGGYLGRFGTQFFAKAVGFIKPNKKEAKLGDANKFHYDEKLKRWVEEGVEQNSEDIALAPPPIMTSFDSGFGTPALETKTGAVIEGQGQVSTMFGTGSLSSDTPPRPPSVNQFSARTRLHGVRSRYVDTFNKGGNTPSPAMSSQSPIVPSTGRSSTSSPVQLFVPASSPSPLNEFMGMPSHNGQVNVDKSELPPGATLYSILNGHSQAEHEPLEPKNLSSSFMAVPAIPRHASATNVSTYTRDESAAASGVVGGLSDMSNSAAGNMSRAISWSGDSSNLTRPDVSKFIPTVSGPFAMQTYAMPNGGNLRINHTLPVKAETSRTYSAEGSTLPSPPLIEHPPSYMGIDNSLLPGAMEVQLVPGAPSSGQEGIYGDMQEVEL